MTHYVDKLSPYNKPKLDCAMLLCVVLGRLKVSEFDRRRPYNLYFGKRMTT